MPQMAPYNWLSLFLMFNFIMIYMISFNHFTTLSSYNWSANKSNKIYYKWLW